MKKLFTAIQNFLLIYVSYSSIDAIRFSETPSFYHYIILAVSVIYFIFGNIYYKLDSIYERVTFNVWCVLLIILVLLIICQASIDKKRLYIIFSLYAVFMLLWAFLMDKSNFKKDKL